MDYENKAKIFKALSDPKRLQIIAMLSVGELCACDILTHFNCTQPTLSHHMKILLTAGLVTSRKEGTWHHYSLDQALIQETANTLTAYLLKEKEPNSSLHEGSPHC